MALPHYRITVLTVLFFLCSFSAETVSSSIARIDNSPIHVKKNYNPESILSKAKTNSAPLLQSHHHSMSSRTLVINVIADLCPHGMLPLAYGIMKGPTGIIPALLLLVFFGSLSAYTMTSYATLARDTKSSTISEIWGKLVSEKTKYMADLSLLALCFGCCVFYSAFIGDIFSALFSALGVTGILAKRSVLLTLISSFVLLPLCQLEDISALSFSSILGVFGIFYTFVFHILRYLDKSYAPKGGEFYLKLATKSRPEWPTPLFSIWKVNKGTLQLVNMLGVAFLAHYNAINYYKELDQSTIAKYSKAITIGFGIAMTCFIGMMIIGYLLFGTTVQPLILNNFHRTDDMLATLARLATGLAITFAYPLMFAGLKTSLQSLLTTATSSVAPPHDGKNKKQTNITKTKLNSFKLIAIPIVLSLITGIAIKCGEEDVSLVLGVVGSILGCTVAYILPGYLNLLYLRKFVPNASTTESLKSWLLIVLGSVFSVLGVWVTLDSAGGHGHSH